jgi:hypothetical protein
VQEKLQAEEKAKSKPKRKSKRKSLGESLEGCSLLCPVDISDKALG